MSDMLTAQLPASTIQPRVRAIFGPLMLVMPLASLDQTIVSTALPTIAGEFGGLEHLSWIVTAYMLATTVKHLNNIVEADHGKLQRLNKPTLGFKSMKTAYATLKGLEVKNALRKGQAALWRYEESVLGEVCLINRQFGNHSI